MVSNSARAASVFLMAVVWPQTCVNAQGCANTCPPLDTSGQPVPSLCVGDDASGQLSGVDLSVCHPDGVGSIQLADYMGHSAPNGPARLVVFSNYFVGCNAGRREANVFSYVATMMHERFPNVHFISSLKGGGSRCQTWAANYQTQGAVAMLDFVPEVVQPITVDDSTFALRDVFFTAPYPHPSYTIVNHEGIVSQKFVGPCCGYSSYSSCSTSVAMGLNETLHSMLLPMLEDIAALYGGNADCFFTEWTPWSECASCDSADSRTRTRTLLQRQIGSGSCGASEETEECTCEAGPVDCAVGEWSAWSSCNVTCGIGEMYRTRAVNISPAFGGAACPELADLAECGPDSTLAEGTLPACEEGCIPELGSAVTAIVVATTEHGLSSPRDISFSPAPGTHLGNFSSGRSFPTTGDEAWVANGGSHSITVLPGIGVAMAALTRYDRGWYHYMVNITAISFNSVSASGRDPMRDTFGYFATCQDNNNTYAGTKDPNFFMGPSLYSQSPEYPNLVRSNGSPCTPADECFLLHADMLHESPSCPGIVHDPETNTAYGSVFWAIDAVAGHLVRYDFQQPHGAGLMDHSVASVRRFPEIAIRVAAPGVHQGMAVDAERRVLYVASGGEGKVIQVHIDSGRYVRTAREDFPIFSSRLPSFEYSIYGCVDNAVFADGLDVPSGLALSASRLFVAEYGSGRLVVFDTITGFMIKAFEADVPGLSGLAFAPSSGSLFGVNALTDQLLQFEPSVACEGPAPVYATQDFELPLELQRQEVSQSQCEVPDEFPDSELFEQVHAVTVGGYASDDAAVQNDTMMDASAALLANRTDCEPNSTLNFDALLLGGYLCHSCLPDNCAARDGGRCVNVQWSGYTCDNEIRVDSDSAGSLEVSGSVSFTDSGALALEQGRTYRFIVNSESVPVHIVVDGEAATDEVRVGLLTFTPNSLSQATLVGSGGVSFSIEVVTDSTSLSVSTTSSIRSSLPMTTTPAATSSDPSNAASTTTVTRTGFLESSTSGVSDATTVSTSVLVATQARTAQVPTSAPPAPGASVTAAPVEADELVAAEPDTSAPGALQLQTTAAAAVVSGSFILALAEPASFVADPLARSVLESSIAASAGADAEQVTVALSALRRLQVPTSEIVAGSPPTPGGVVTASTSGVAVGFSVHCVSSEEAEGMVSEFLAAGEQGVAAAVNGEFAAVGLPYNVEVTGMSAFVPGSASNTEPEAASGEEWQEELNNGARSAVASPALRGAPALLFLFLFGRAGM